ncbi:uncharacterized protein [Musca autumnalis]|uniref:uncharacterized protein n=1 Tax=Musca autumnalis TaxID=221902 RepID=UPI003CF3F197
MNILTQLTVLVIELEEILRDLSECLDAHNKPWKGHNCSSIEPSRNQTENNNKDAGRVIFENNHFRPFQMKRILAMKHIYSQVHTISRISASLYGPGVLLANILFVSNLSLYCYIFITSMTHGAFKGIEVVINLYFILPPIVKCLFLCRLCGNFKKKTSSILSKLTSSPVKSPLLDDFILQIRQNPIKFTAYDFYELNSETLTKVSVIVFDLMLFLLQIFTLTNIA